MSDDFHRRASDQHHDSSYSDEELLTLIRRAKDEDQKQYLIILYRLNLSQSRLVGIIAGLEQRLELEELATAAHKELVVKVAGAYRATAIGMGAFLALFGILGSLGAYIWLGHVEDLRRVARENAEQALAINELRQNPPISRESDKRLAVIESTLKDIINNQIDNRQHFGEVERAIARLQQGRK